MAGESHACNGPTPADDRPSPGRTKQVQSISSTVVHLDVRAGAIILTKCTERMPQWGGLLLQTSRCLPNQADFQVTRRPHRLVAARFWSLSVGC